jgi:dipeptidyl aminopeptidase/acylaminoacyl peptidase
MSQKTPFSLDDYYNFKFIGSTAISPDESKIAYVVLSYSDTEEKNTNNDEFYKTENSNIWILDVNTKTSKQFTFGKTNNLPSWSPDGKTLAFVSKRDGESQIYIINIEGGEAQQLTNLKLGVGSKPIWSPDGSKIAFSASSLEKKPDLKKPYRFKRDFYRFDVAGNVDNFKENIYFITINTKEIKQLTNDDQHHANPRWSPDGMMLLWQNNFSKFGVDAFYPTFSIFKNEKASEYLNEWGYCNLVEWVTNEIIVIQGRPKNRTIGIKDDIYTFNLNTRGIECRSKTCLLGIGSSLETFIPGSEARLNKLLVKDNFVYTSVQIGGKISILSFSLEDEERVIEIAGGERSCYIQGNSKDFILFISSHLNSLIDIFLLNISSGKEEQLTFINKEFLNQKLLPNWQKLEFLSIDGTKVDGWFLEPQGKAPFPTLLKIHGGPHSGYGNVYYWDAQLLCGAGYGILMVNHRGSSGYGDKFATAIIGDWGNLDYSDLMAGVDAGIKLGLIDSDRLGCFGISGGGNLSSWIVGQTDRFKAAVPENPVTNWLSFYGVSDIGRWFSVQEIGGLPHELPDKYVKMSPITYAHRCKTPTLLIQHDNDLRCPVEQSEQFYAVLKDAGCEVEMLRMPGTPHAGSVIGPLEIRHARSEALLDWFKKYV